MNSFKKLYKADIGRCGWDNKWAKKFSYYHRKAQTTKFKLLCLFYRYIFRAIRQKNGLEMSYNTSIGKGFKLMHPYNITINALAVIGDNVDVYKGVTIGQEFRGPRKGVPVIGNNVWIGPNSTIVGNVKIGNDVLIAANTFVNCDIPDHSVVIGNPCIIKHKENATEGYIINPS